MPARFVVIKCSKCGQIDMFGSYKKSMLYCNFCKGLTLWERYAAAKAKREADDKERQLEFSFV